MRGEVTFTPDTVFESQRPSKEYRTFTVQQRRVVTINVDKYVWNYFV